MGPQPWYEALSMGLAVAPLSWLNWRVDRYSGYLCLTLGPIAFSFSWPQK